MRFATPFGSFSIDDMPGSPQIGIVHNTFIEPCYRGQGRGKDQHHEMLRVASWYHYDVLMCTVESTNDRELAILKKFGWTELYRFTSQKSGHEIVTFKVELKDLKL